MSIIRLLSPDLVSQIAAGEVIERPASVVKELVENSLDAGASEILVDVADGGMKRIRVLDNGSGIRSAEIGLAFARHATSKISSLDDLFSIQSMGFRGEALASIASVARVTVKSRHEDESVGALLELDGGRELRREDWAGPRGSEFEILALFHHTPARKKYMKTERTEFGAIHDWILEAALANPRVAFRLHRDGKEVLNLPGSSDLKGRIQILFGAKFFDSLLPLRFEQSNLRVSGFIGKPELSTSGKKYQFIFVNDRPIQSRVLGAAVKQAYHSLLMHEKNPAYFLFLDIDPKFVDVNVHPRKLEVRFVNREEVFRAVLGSVKHALESSLLSPVMGGAGRDFARVRDFSPVAELKQSTLELNEGAQSQNSQMPFEVKGLALRPVAQIARSYIVAESDSGLVLIDQHAAHERVRYENFMRDLEESKKVSRQVLLQPVDLDLGLAGQKLLEDHAEDFSALGFELEEFGGDRYLLRAVPKGFEKNPEKVLLEILSELCEEEKKANTKPFREKLLTTAACRGAIKFGDPLTLLEMQGLLADMEKTRHSTHCPHGRPALLEFKFEELETLFKRRNF